jgi:NADH-quinone oxidoreductase subunit N
MPYLELLKLASPEAIVAFTALLVLAIGLATSRGRAVARVSSARPAVSTAKPPPHAGGHASVPGEATTLCAFVAAAGLLFAIGAVLLLPANATLFDGMLVISPLSSLFKIICLALAFFTVLLAQSGPPIKNGGEYLALMLMGTIGLLLLVGGENLLMIFIGLELLGLSLYVMAAFDKSDVRSAEAGLKYFLFGSTASAFTLFGISLIYGMSGTVDLAAMAEKLATTPLQPLVEVGVVMTLIGFGFKIAAVPFHLWAPDAYQGAPVPSAAFIASGSKVASFVVLGRIVLVGFGPVHGNAAWHQMIAGWTPLLAVLAGLSILVGNFVALAQTNVRRLLAYSAVAHGGYTLMGLVAGGRNGFSATLFYTTVYAVTLIGAFGVVAFVRRETGGDNLKDFAGLRSRPGSGLAVACMSIFMLSLAGMPPLPGFFGKFFLFSATLRAGGNHGLLWLVAIALFGSFVSLYYYLMVIKVMFVDQAAPETSLQPSVQGLFLQRLTLLVLAGAVLFLGVFPSALLSHIAAALP